MDHLGNVYVADTGNHAIRIIYPTGRVQTLAGTGREGHQDGGGSTSTFSSPSGIAVWRDWQSWPLPDANDEDSFIIHQGNGTVILFVADSGNHRIRKVSLLHETNEVGVIHVTKAVVECFSGICKSNPRAGFSDGTKEQARFDSPKGLTVTSDGLVYVSDMNNHLIRVIDRFGNTQTVAGSTKSEVSINDIPIERCPYPCRSGVSGYQDGSVKSSKFSFPVGIALGSYESILFVTDQSRIRMIDLVTNEVHTIAGGNEAEERDGYDLNASFLKPHGITVDSKGFIYVTDMSSCRVRRLSFPHEHYDEMKCENSFASATRPSGCTSYNDETDILGLKATPLSGSSYFNYLHRNISSNSLGRDFVGRGVKDCVGSPPADKIIEIDGEVLELNDILNINEIREDPNEGTMIQVDCPWICSQSTEPVFGAKFESFYLYSESSSICVAAYHAGLLIESAQNVINVIERKKPKMNPSTYFIFSVTVGERDVSFDEISPHFGLTNRLFSVERASEAVVVHTISGAPTTIAESSCGYHDSVPAQGAKVS